MSAAQLQRIGALLEREGVDIHPDKLEYLIRSLVGRRSDRAIADYVRHMIGEERRPVRASCGWAR